MNCPECNAWATTKETRARPDKTIRRRYECANLHRFTTIERLYTEQDFEKYLEQRKQTLIENAQAWREKQSRRKQFRNYR